MATIRYITRFMYKCPVCGKETASAAGMCKHIINTSTSFEAHWNWMAAHGINVIDTVGNHKPLIKLVEKGCNKYKIEERVLTIEGHKPKKDKVLVVKRHK
jgi:hypothetical protein